MGTNNHQGEHHFALTGSVTGALLRIWLAGQALANPDITKSNKGGAENLAALCLGVADDIIALAAKEAT